MSDGGNESGILASSSSEHKTCFLCGKNDIEKEVMFVYKDKEKEYTFCTDEHLSSFLKKKTEAEWSLKGKGGYLSGYNDKGHFSESVYKSEDIETLRQKLIEDVTAMREDLFTGRNWKTVVLSIINKRFGVKE
jgi:hypothetical protein